MKLNLRTKLIGSFVIILSLMVVVGSVGVYTSRHIENHLEDIVEQDVKTANILGVVARRVGFIHSNSLLHLFTRSIEDMGRYESEIADWEGKINTDLDTLENTFKDQATLDKLAEFRAAWEMYLRIWNEQVVPLSRADRDEETFELVRKRGTAGLAAQEAMYKLDELHEAIIATANDNLELAEQDFRKSQNILLAVIFLTIALGLAFGIKQGSLIAGAVNTVSEAAQRVAAGDLDQSVMLKTGDEIESMADSFNTMTSNTKNMVEELRHEITERLRVEQALRESEQWLSTTLRSIGDAVIATDDQGLVTLMNPVAEDLTGWGEAESVGKPLEDVLNIINEQTGERAENPVDRVLREGVIVGLANHTALIAKDGTKRPIADSGAPIRDEQGNIIGTVMVFRDITESKQAEVEIASLAKFPSENLNPVLRVAKDGTILYANKASQPLLKGWRCQVNQPLPDDWRKFILDVLSSGLSKDAEIEYENRILSLAFAPVVEKDYINVYGLDITERKEMQERLVRTEKLAVLGQLAGGVGHELRNPLGAIKNAAYYLNMVLSEGEPEPEVKETLEILEKEVAMSEGIISSLLDFARTKPPILRKVDINEVLQEAMSRAAVPDDPQVEIVSQLDEELPAILADPHQLAQIFRNIILNGIQAMTEGGQLVIKTAQQSSPKSEWVVVSITDTGSGIPQENLDKLFQPLFTTKAKGIGLGLAVTKTLVEGHRGTIEVESEEDKGSTFTVRLPRGREENK